MRGALDRVESKTRKAGRAWLRTRGYSGALILGLLGALSGCASKTVPPASGAEQQGKLEIVEIKTADFAPSVERVLTDETDGKRLERLASIVRYQLGRAEWLFKAGYDRAGLDAVSGAFYLLRAGELRQEMIQGRELALRLAVNAVAQSGDEGRAKALYSMLEQILAPGAARDDVHAHLVALGEWQRDTVMTGSMEAAARAQQSAVSRALLEPSHAAYKVAREATVQWISRGRAMNGELRRPPETLFEKEEGDESRRAMELGPITLTALTLRFRDAAGGVQLLEQPGVAPIVPPNLRDTLDAAANEHNQEAWAGLFGLFEGSNNAEERLDLGLDPELTRGAAWGAAIELYRIDPTALRSVVPLASLLVAHQMADAATLLLVRSLGKSPEQRELGWALSLITQALSGLEALGDLNTARAVFAGTNELFASADKATPETKKGLSSVLFVMGEMESRSGELSKAREHLVTAIHLVPTLEALRLLSAIDRQRGSTADVIASLTQMAGLSEKAGEPATLAETQVLLFEVYRELGQQNDARTVLEAALQSALKARASATVSAEQASAERVLARVLEEYGELDGASRAAERAFNASQYDTRQFAVTVLDSARRAISVSDLSGARNAVRRGIDGQIEDQDLVYAALWLKLLERQLKAESDGTAEEAFAKITQRGSWSAALRDWALAKLNDEGLRSAAKTRIERAEALFYTAMAARVSTPRKGGNDALKAVVSSEAVDLIEVTIARDLLARDAGLFKPTLPKGVAIP